MKKVYEKPILTVVDLKPEEQIGACEYVKNNPHQTKCKLFKTPTLSGM